MRSLIKNGYPFFIYVFLLHTFFLSLFGIRLFGFRFFANQTSSMKPVINPGDLMVVHKEDQYSYLPGDIITFYSWETGKETVITHRVHRIGGNVYITKGDANAAIDAEPVRPRLIVGRVIFSFPLLGNYILLSKTPLGLGLTVFLPAILILINELKIIIFTLSKAKRKPV